jgi:hypothetical protein
MSVTLLTLISIAVGLPGCRLACLELRDRSRARLRGRCRRLPELDLKLSLRIKWR